MLDEGGGLLKPSLKNLQKWRSQSLSEQLFSTFFLASSWGFSCSNLYLLPVILLLCFCSSEENLAVLSLITPPPVEDGNEVPSLPALPQALQAQLSHAHHLSNFMCSIP